MSPGILIVLAIGPGQVNGHEELNPLYKDLRQAGIAVSGTRKSPLPAPSMADGLDARAQRAVIEKVAGEDYAVEELVRRSVVAPHILRIRDITPADPQAPARGVDAWFIAYGDLKTIANKEFLDRLLNANREEGKARTLSAADLAKRGIAVGADQEKKESFGNIVFNFLDRVEISVTGQSYWSQSGESIVAASKLDRRFRSDGEFPNQWRPLTRNDDGKVEPGSPQPYDGAGYYVKITRLAEPKGALFIEGHLIFAEPVKWFGGANLLRSKLPPVIQAQVRSARRELIKAVP
jgi:hypothetical protein